MGKIISSYYGEKTSQLDMMYSKMVVPADAKNIGRWRMKRKDGYCKGDGSAKYTMDVALPGCLFARVLICPYAHAKIKSMDTTAAEALPGVRGILRYDDPVDKVEAALLTLEGLHANQPIGIIVAADSPGIADEALKLTKVEWEELPFELDWEVAVQDKVILYPNAGKSNWTGGTPRTIGDPESGFKTAEQTIEWSWRREEVLDPHAEPNCMIIYWEGEECYIWNNYQRPLAWQAQWAPTCPMNKQHYYNIYFGGQLWGTGKQAMANLGQPLMVLAKRLRRPLKFVMDADHTDFWGHDWTCGTLKFKVGFKKDGTITAVEGNVLEPRGCIEDLMTQTSIPNLKETIIRIRNAGGRGPSNCHRDGGDYQMQANYVINRVAAALNMDPTAVMIRNDGSVGTSWDGWAQYRKDHFQQPNRHSLVEVIDAAKKAINWDSKWHKPGERILANGRYHGLGVAWAFEWSNIHRSAHIGLKVNPDGSVNILGRHTDIGVGADTCYCQIVADELGVPYESVTQRGFSDSDTAWEWTDPGGSTNTVNNSPSLVRLAAKAKQMILEFACEPRAINQQKNVVWPVSRASVPAAFSGKKPEELDMKDGVIFEKANPTNKKTLASICGTTFGNIEPIVVDDYTGPVSARVACASQCHMVEVEVDPDTGMVYLTNAVAVNDVGKVISPEGVRGQQVGGLYTGLSNSNTEEVFYDPLTGVKLNDSLISYPLPLYDTIGTTDYYQVETQNGYGAYGLLGVGENIHAVVFSVTQQAVYNALGIWPDVMPTTPDKILKLLGKA
jgi:CO/xanthine dehydrogenase Mo-binding subunit